MAINKVIDRNGNTLIDLTNDTIEAGKVLSGVKFHGRDGKEYTGLINADIVDSLKTKFYDLEGELVASYTDDELNNLTELPSLPELPDDIPSNIYEAKNWNWSLEELKAWNFSRPDRPIVAPDISVITPDNACLIMLVNATPSVNADKDFTIALRTVNYSSTDNTDFVYDWGDGTSDSPTSSNDVKHKYAEEGIYLVTVYYTGDSDRYKNLYITGKISGTWSILVNKGYWGSTSEEYGGYAAVKVPDSYKCLKTDGSFVTDKLAVISKSTYTESFQYESKIISISPTCKHTYLTFQYNTEELVIPDTVETTTVYIRSTPFLKSIYIPDVVTKLTISYLPALTSLRIPNTLTTLDYKSIPLIRDTFNLPAISSPTSWVFGDSWFNNLIIDNGWTYIPEYFCSNSKATYVKISNSVESFRNGAFGNGFCNSYKSATLDLTELDHVITLSASVNFGKILVPSDLVDSYKNATYWSNLANYIEGV